MPGRSGSVVAALSEKNVNEGEVKKVWRYQAWDSYSPNEQKWRTLVAT